MPPGPVSLATGPCGESASPVINAVSCHHPRWTNVRFQGRMKVLNCKPQKIHSTMKRDTHSIKRFTQQRVCSCFVVCAWKIKKGTRTLTEAREPSTSLSSASWNDTHGKGHAIPTTMTRTLNHFRKGKCAVSASGSGLPNWDIAACREQLVAMVYLPNI